jgi:putative membrane protein insertion efficiency factor
MLVRVHKYKEDKFDLCKVVIVEKVIIFLIRIYQRIAPKRLRDSCRYIPSCSEYMILAVKRHGTKAGIQKGVKRIIRCKVPNGALIILKNCNIKGC